MYLYKCIILFVKILLNYIDEENKGFIQEVEKKEKY